MKDLVDDLNIWRLPLRWHNRYYNGQGFNRNSNTGSTMTSIGAFGFRATELPSLAESVLKLQAASMQSTESTQLRSSRTAC